MRFSVHRLLLGILMAVTEISLAAPAPAPLYRAVLRPKALSVEVMLSKVERTRFRERAAVSEFEMRTLGKKSRLHFPPVYSVFDSDTSVDL